MLYLANKQGIIVYKIKLLLQNVVVKVESYTIPKASIVSDKSNILLVEDDESHATLIIRTFERLGVWDKIDWVKDGEEALNYLYKYENSPDNKLPSLVILDLRLPKLNGHEVLREIKSSDNLKVIPVVILTTSTSNEDVVDAYVNYANSYLVKPINFEALQETIKEIVTYWMEWNLYPQKN